MCTQLCNKQRELSLQNPKKELNVCIMRIIAAFFVIMIHVCGSNTLYRLVLNCISRFSVPVFVMISGRFMLAKKYSFSNIVGKVLHLLFLMLLWSAIFYLFALLRGSKSELSFLSYLPTEPIHLWYLWATIPLYLAVPILSVFCENATKKVYLYALGFTFVSGTVITLLMRSEISAEFATIINRSKLPYQQGFVFCFLFGDFCRRHDSAIPKWVGPALFCLGTAGSVFGLSWVPLDLLLSFFSPMVVIASMGMFLFFLQCNFDKAEKLRPLLQTLSDCTLGIYLLHPLLISPVSTALDRCGVPSAVFPFLCAFLVFVFSLVLTYLFRKTPLLKRIVQ